VEAELSVLHPLRFPTPAAKYHQACREQVAFFENLFHLSFAYRRKLLDLSEIQNKIADATGIELERLRIDAEEAIYMLEVMKHEGRERVREIGMWEEIKQKCLGEDPTIHPEDKNADQLAYFALEYCQKLKVLGKETDPMARANIIGQAVSGLMACDAAHIDLGDVGVQARKWLKKGGYL